MKAVSAQVESCNVYGDFQNLYPQFHWLRQIATLSPHSNIEL